MTLATASPIEILWTIVAVLGAGIELYSLYDAFSDRLAVTRAHLNGPMHLVSDMAIRTSAVALGIQVIFIILGVLAMANPEGRPSNFGTVARVLLVLAATAIVGASLLNQVDRHSLRRRFGYPKGRINH